MPETDEIDKDLLGEEESTNAPSVAPSPFSPPTTLGAGLPPLEPMHPFGRPQTTGTRPRPISGSGRLPTFSSLESLYGYVQELGSDQARMRVERIEPQWVQDASSSAKIPVAGIIAYLEDTPSTQQFARRFGGRKYKVWAEKQIEDKMNGGEPRMMDVAVAEFQVPLDPNMDDLPIVGDEPEQEPFDAVFQSGGDQPYKRYSQMNRRGVFFQSPQQGFRPDDAVNLIRTGAEMARGTNQPVSDSTGSLQFLSGLTQQQQEQMREYASRQEEIYRDQVRQRDKQLEEMRTEMREMRNRPTSQGEVLGGVAQLVSAMRGSSTEMEASQLRSSHEREIDRLNDNFQRERDATRREFERDIASARAEARADKERWAEKERDLQREMDRRDQMARDEMDRREKSVRADAEREITLLRQTYEAQLASMRQTSERELAMNRMHSEMLSKQSETSKEMLMEGLRKDLANLTATADRLREENDELRARVNLSVEEAIDRAHNLARKTGMVAKDELPDTGVAEPPRSRVDQIIETLANAAVSNAPAILQNLGGLASSRKEEAAQVQQLQQPARIVAQHPAHRFVDAGEEFVSMQQLPHSRQYQPRAAAPQPQHVTQPAVQSQPQPQQAMQPAAHPQQVMQPAAAPQHVAPPAQTNPWEGFEWTSLEPQQLQELFETIEASMGKEPPEALEALRAKYGDTIDLVAAFATADKVIESVQRAPATRRSRLASASGRRHLRRIWDLMSPPTEEAGPS